MISNRQSTWRLNFEITKQIDTEFSISRRFPWKQVQITKIVQILKTLDLDLGNWRVPPHNTFIISIIKIKVFPISVYYLHISSLLGEFEFHARLLNQQSSRRETRKHDNVTS